MDFKKGDKVTWHFHMQKWIGYYQHLHNGVAIVRDVQGHLHRVSKHTLKHA